MDFGINRFDYQNLGCKWVHILIVHWHLSTGAPLIYSNEGGGGGGGGGGSPSNFLGLKVWPKWFFLVQKMLEFFLGREEK